MQRTRSSRAGGDEEDPGSDYDRKRKGGAGRKAVGLCCIILSCWVLCVVAAGLDAAARPPPPKTVDPAEAAAAVEHLRKRAYGPSGGLDHDAWRRGSGISAHVVPQPVEPPKPPPQKVFRRRKKTRKEENMPPFAAPRLDPFLHKSKMKGPLSITQCQAHEKAVPFHQRALQKIDIKKTADAPSLLCIIYTYKAHHTKNARTAAETWLPRCDGAVILSDQSDSEEGIVGVPHEGKEEYNNI